MYCTWQAGRTFKTFLSISGTHLLDLTIHFYSVHLWYIFSPSSSLSFLCVSYTLKQFQNGMSYPHNLAAGIERFVALVHAVAH